MATKAKGKPKPFPERLRAAREKAGLTLLDADFALNGTMPSSLGAGQASINRWERGLMDEEAINPFTLAALSRIYGVPLEELSQIAAEDVALTIDLLERPRDDDIWKQQLRRRHRRGKYAARDSNPEPADCVSDRRRRRYAVPNDRLKIA